MQVDYHELDHLDLKSRTMREARELLDYRGKGTAHKFEGEDLEKDLEDLLGSPTVRVGYGAKEHLEHFGKQGGDRWLIVRFEHHFGVAQPKDVAPELFHCVPIAAGPFLWHDVCGHKFARGIVHHQNIEQNTEGSKYFGGQIFFESEYEWHINFT